MAHQLATGRLSRRQLLLGAAGCALAVPVSLAFPARLARAALARPAAQPALPWGVQSGDVTASSTVVWSASDRPARMVVEYATTESFANPSRVVGPVALPETGYTAKLMLTGLPAGQDIFYRVSFEDLMDLSSVSPAATGHFRTAATDLRDISFAWSGDTAGQGWGINPDWGGMKIYEVMRGLQPDFFVHSGDMIYADGPIMPQVELPDGSIWKNLVTEEKSKVAETLDEYRGNYKYNLMDENVRRFNADVPVYVQWDDHEVTNNWYWERVLQDDRYRVKNVALLAARGRRAMFEFTPIAVNPSETERVYRAFHRGPLLDLFMLDMRSYRGPNSENTQTELADEARILGRAQVSWLKEQLLRSQATWKVIAADMPLGLIVWHDAQRQWGSEAVAQGDGPALGRELEIADLLRFIKASNIQNVVWITADVHYCATHYYNPERAQFTDFKPFYEFVSGPLHAGGFGPNPLDNTFGPEVVFSKHPPEGRSNTPPTEGGLYFGHVRIDAATRTMTVSHRDVSGAVLHQIELQPEA